MSKITEEDKREALQGWLKADPPAIGLLYPPVSMPMRRALQKHGLIKTHRPSMLASNRRMRWHMTEAGFELARSTTSGQPGEGGDPPSGPPP